MRNPLQRLLVRLINWILGEPPKPSPRSFFMTVEEWDVEKAAKELARIRAIIEKEEQLAHYRAQLQVSVIQRTQKPTGHATP